MKRPTATPAELAIADHYRVTFSTTSGRVVLEHMRHRGFYRRSLSARPAKGVGIDPLETMRNVGMRDFHLDTEYQIFLGEHATPTEPLPVRATGGVSAEAPEEQ